MQVMYVWEGIPCTLEIDEREDLKALLLDIEQALRREHPEAFRSSRLITLITEHVLNALADDQTEISLGEIAPAKT